MQYGGEYRFGLLVWLLPASGLAWLVDCCWLLVVCVEVVSRFTLDLNSHIVVVQGGQVSIMGSGSSSAGKGSATAPQKSTSASSPAENPEAAPPVTKEEVDHATKTIDDAVVELTLYDIVEEKKPKEGNGATMQIPATLDEVTVEFVTHALKSSGHIKDGTTVVSFEKIKFGREKGYLGDKCLLKDIAYAPSAPESALTSIFVKLFPSDPVVPAAVVERFWDSEVEFLTKTVKTLPDSDKFKVPEIYFAEKGKVEEGKPPRQIILMESIDDTNTYDILGSMPVSHALRAAEDLAILQAPYWGWSLEKFRSELMFDKFGHIQEQTGLARGMFTMGTNAGLRLFASKDSPLSASQKEEFAGYVEFWKFYEQEIWPYLQKRWDSVFKRWTSIPATLIHCDFHVENMICLKDGSNVYLDFQSVRGEGGVRDLAWLLTSSLKSEDRRESESKILEVYHHALVSRGVEGYSLTQCWQDFIFMKIAGLWAGILGAGMFASKNFSEKSGIFAAQPAEDAIAERKRNSLLFSRIVDDLKHSNWSQMLKSLDEDAEAPDS